jgi:hypothetical protein
MTEGKISPALETILARAPFQQWYRDRVGAENLVASGAVEDFQQRSVFFEISPVPLFDPTWFRTRYRVKGRNAFLSYLADSRQRLARPSPLFAPRWYCRQYGLVRSSAHPLLDYLTNGQTRSPHPLIDVEFLKQQCTSWNSEWIALEFLSDPEKRHLKPHPLFDSGWYLTTYPDVAQSKFNPLEHYLYFGCVEGRSPNGIFNMAWYKDEYLNTFRNKHAAGIDPLTHYVTRGFAAGHTPAPGLQGFSKATTPMTKHGPKILIDCLEKNRNIYAQFPYRPQISLRSFNYYLSASIGPHNPAFREPMVLLPKNRVAIMYVAKCASGKILYWWLEKASLLECAMRFSDWSHEFREIYRQSREFIADRLMFDPEKYNVYKFVRDPLQRTVSMFTHFLTFPSAAGIAPGNNNRFSFVDFLQHLRSTDLMQRDPHFGPQLGNAEASGKIKPTILKLEDGLNSHFAFLEQRHRLPRSTFQDHWEISETLRIHTKQPSARISAGPAEKVSFGEIPHAGPLLTGEVIDQIYELYRCDFEAYGYERPVQSSSAGTDSAAGENAPAPPAPPEGDAGDPPSATIVPSELSPEPSNTTVSASQRSVLIGS